MSAAEDAEESVPPWPRPLLTGLAIAYVLYLAAFVYRTSFVVEGVRYFCLFDDMMISMRYARNLVEGYGLVWNISGNAVEGYTNFLWVLYMAALHWLPVPIAKLSLLVQVSGIAALLGTLYFVRRICTELRTGSRLVQALAVVLTAGYLPLVNWSVQGTEVSVLALVITASAFMAIRVLRDGRSPWPLALLLSLGVLLRLDAVVSFAAIMGMLFLLDDRRRWIHLMAAGLPLVLVLGSMTLFRMQYYDSLLPNTYYLKMTGYPTLLRISRGVYVFADFLWASNLLLMAAPFLHAALRRDRVLLLLVGTVLGQFAYQVYVGGDAWEWWGSRYVTVVMPLFFVLLAGSLDALLGVFGRAGELPRSVVRRAPAVACGVVATILLAQLNAFTHPLHGLLKVLTVTIPINADVNQAQVELSRVVDQIASSDAKVAVNYAGTLPYFNRRQIVDLLGKSDAEIARGPAHLRGSGLERYIAFLPGHMKWDSRHSILTLRPDLVADLPYDYKEYRAQLASLYENTRFNGQDMLLLRGSDKIHWEMVRELNEHAETSLPSF